MREYYPVWLKNKHTIYIPARFMKDFHPSADQSQENKAKNKKQLAREMGIHPNTLSRRLKDAGLNVPRGFVSPQQQEEIFRLLGWRE